MQEEIIISNKEEFNKKISTLKQDGINNTHIVSDFDRTLSKHSINGKKIASGFGLIRNGNYLPEDYAKKTLELFYKYYPIENDLSLDETYRYEKMNEWWNGQKENLVRYGMNQEIINKIIEENPKIFREGLNKFLKIMSNHNVPILILSAGLGNLIEGYLKSENLLTKNIQIIANTLIFNKEGNATDYKNKIIHVLNKSETVIKETIKDKDYLNSILNRKNLILLGDSIGDVDMSKGIEHNIILKIGFLNYDIEKNLEIYKKNYDMIITNDGSFKKINNIIKKIIQ